MNKKSSLFGFDAENANQLLNVTIVDILNDVRLLGVPEHKMKLLYGNACRILNWGGDMDRRCKAVEKVVDILKHGNVDAIIEATWLRDACGEWKDQITRAA